MARKLTSDLLIYSAIFILLLLPAPSQAQPEQSPGLLSVSQQLVREGDFAVRLHSALGLGAAEDEAAAESGLGQTQLPSEVVTGIDAGVGGDPDLAIDGGRLGFGLRFEGGL